MWCSECQKDFPSDPEAEIQVCPHCQSAARVGRTRRRVPKLHPAESKPKIRIDAAHPVRTGSTGSNVEQELITKAGTWLGIRSLNHLSIFGLFIFLSGQSILAWAFLVGNYTAWSVANLISVSGITISIIAVAMTMRNFDRRIQHLARLVGRPRRPRKKNENHKSPLEKK